MDMGNPTSNPWFVWIFSFLWEGFKGAKEGHGSHWWFISRDFSMPIRLAAKILRTNLDSVVDLVFEGLHKQVHGRVQTFPRIGWDSYVEQVQGYPTGCNQSWCRQLDFFPSHLVWWRVNPLLHGRVFANFYTKL